MGREKAICRKRCYRIPRRVDSFREWIERKRSLAKRDLKKTDPSTRRGWLESIYQAVKRMVVETSQCEKERKVTVYFSYPDKIIYATCGKSDIPYVLPEWISYCNYLKDAHYPYVELCCTLDKLKELFRKHNPEWKFVETAEELEDHPAAIFVEYGTEFFFSWKKWNTENR